MKRLLILFLILTGLACGQQPSAYVPQLITYQGVPYGSCQIYQFAENVTTAQFYNCLIVGGSPTGTWQLAGGGSAGGGIINDILTATGVASSAFTPPGIPLGNAGAAVSSCPYTVQADTASTTLDRGTVIELNSASSCSVTLPDTGGTGVTNNFPVRFRNVGAGLVTISRTTSSTFSVVNGSAASTGGTSFTLSTGQFATCYGDNVSVWRCDKVATNGISNFSTSSLTPGGGAGTY